MPDLAYIMRYDRSSQTNHDIGYDVGRIVALNNLGYAYFLPAQLPETIKVLHESISESTRLNLIRDEAYA
tara:strand:+ start:253 stop:462 length:210 start_codon:yes stop_codon:yes gene_type:complete